jgi:hypothetical protein
MEILEHRMHFSGAVRKIGLAVEVSGPANVYRVWSSFVSQYRVNVSDEKWPCSTCHYIWIEKTNYSTSQHQFLKKLESSTSPLELVCSTLCRGLNDWHLDLWFFRPIRAPCGSSTASSEVVAGGQGVWWMSTTSHKMWQQSSMFKMFH